MTIVDAQPDAAPVVPSGGPQLPQQRRLVTEIPGPKSRRLLERKAEAVAKGVGHTVPVATVAAGERNGLRLRIYGEMGGIEWDHDAPGNLTLRWPDAHTEILHSGGPGLDLAAQRATRLPSGHPEGFIEAFATLYAGFADAISGDRSDVDGLLPGIGDGLRSMRFIDLAVRSHEARAWLPFSGATR